MNDSVVWIDVDKIHPNKYNPNVMMGEKFEALKEFCQSHGADQLDPIWVRHDGADKFEVVDGEHRWKAVKDIGWKRLRAFIIDLDEEDAKSFNVRKNRERGQLDIFKLGRLFKEERKKGLTVEAIAKKYGYSTKDGSASSISEIIEIADNEDVIRDHPSVATATRISKYKAKEILREMRREERGEPIEKPQAAETVEGTQNLENFLTHYAEALKKNPLPKVEKDDVQMAIDFFKRILKQKHVVCPVCGEQHLQWKCGHEF